MRILHPKKNQQNNQSSVLSRKNSILFVVAVLFTLGSIFYSLVTTKDELSKKRARLNTYTIEEVAAYIMEKNPGIVHIDAITKIHPISFRGNILEFPYHVKDGFLRKFASGLYSTESIKASLQNDTLGEDCRKTAFSVFLQKGGVMHYTYYLDKDTGSEFLFDFNNTWI